MAEENNVENLDDEFPPNNRRVVKVAGQDIILDGNHLAFNETNISQFQERLALWYDYLTNQAAIAEFEETELEDRYDTAYYRFFAHHKESGCTEKLAEAKARVEPDVLESKKQWNRGKLRLKRLLQHIKAWDKAHDSAQNRGHTLRKEMDKLNTDIYYKNKDLSERVDDIVRRSS